LPRTASQLGVSRPGILQNPISFSGPLMQLNHATHNEALLSATAVRRRLEWIQMEQVSGVLYSIDQVNTV
jgi:hypothetical protein